MGNVCGGARTCDADGGQKKSVHIKWNKRWINYFCITLGWKISPKQEQERPSTSVIRLARCEPAAKAIIHFEFGGFRPQDVVDSAPYPLLKSTSIVGPSGTHRQSQDEAEMVEKPWILRMRSRQKAENLPAVKKRESIGSICVQGSCICRMIFQCFGPMIPIMGRQSANTVLTQKSGDVRDNRIENDTCT